MKKSTNCGSAARILPVPAGARLVPILVMPVLLISLSATSICSQEWVDITPAGDSPGPRRNAAAIYNPVDHEIVLFGGRGSSGDHGDLWRFDLSDGSWDRIDAGEGPVPRSTHNAVYDEVSHRMVVWSGRKLDVDGSEFFSDVWGLDIANSQWSLLHASGDSPNRRYGTAAVYDPLSHSLVNFAGFTTAGRFDDTWAFDLGGSGWEELDPDGNPGARCLHTGAYDSRRGRMIIFGGQRGSGALGDTWALDLNATIWQELAPAAGPGGRKFPASIYDEANDRFVVFGGDTGTEKAGGVWALNLADDSWEELSESGQGPTPRDGAVAVYITAEQRLVLFGGTGDEHLNDVWSLSLPTQDPTVIEETESISLPNASNLGQSYPNPFNSTTVIPFHIAELPPGASGDGVDVHLAIFDVLGRHVRDLVRDRMRPGQYELPWNGEDDDGRAAVSGVYFYRLSTIVGSSTRKLLMAR